jgi:hypothetical protein
MRTLQPRKTEEKASALKDGVIYLDQYTDDGKVIFVYFVQGFFMEVITDVGTIIDVIPYLRGRNHKDIKMQRLLSKAILKNDLQS